MKRWKTEDPKDSLDTYDYVILYGDVFESKLILGYFYKGAWFDEKDQPLKKSNVLLWTKIPDYTVELQELQDTRKSK